MRRELQIARNIAANTPAVTTEHIIRIANLISCTSESPGALALHLHQLVHRHHVVVVMAMIMIEPKTIRPVTNTPKAKARKLLA